jgi:hypothetical protein
MCYVFKLLFTCNEFLFIKNFLQTNRGLNGWCFVLVSVAVAVAVAVAVVAASAVVL